MEFKNVEFAHAFYDDWSGNVYYAFKTVPQIDHGEWAISSGGDTAYDLLHDVITQTDFPSELMHLVEHIPENAEIEGLENTE